MDQIAREEPNRRNMNRIRGVLQRLMCEASHESAERKAVGKKKPPGLNGGKRDPCERARGLDTAYPSDLQYSPKSC
jgi:hypothetical protein